jgi:hypothetical protein
MSPGTNAGVQVVVPAGSGITIREAKVWWYVPQQTSGATTFALATSNGGILGESATPLERRGSPDVFALPSSTTSLTLDGPLDGAGSFGAGRRSAVVIRCGPRPSTDLACAEPGSLPSVRSGAPGPYGRACTCGRCVLPEAPAHESSSGVVPS